MQTACKRYCLVLYLLLSYFLENKTVYLFYVFVIKQIKLLIYDVYLKVEERKQFGTIIVKGELPLEAQLQAEREAVDRKEKEVKYL